MVNIPWFTPFHPSVDRQFIPVITGFHTSLVVSRISEPSNPYPAHLQLLEVHSTTHRRHICIWWGLTCPNTRSSLAAPIQFSTSEVIFIPLTGKLTSQWKNDEPKLKMYVLLRMEPFPFWRKLSPFWMMINPWCIEVVLRKRTLQKSFFEGKIIHGIRKVVQISWSRVGFRTFWRGLGFFGAGNPSETTTMTMSGKPITNPASLGKAVLLWSP